MKIGILQPSIGSQEENMKNSLLVSRDPPFPLEGLGHVTVVGNVPSVDLPTGLGHVTVVGEDVSGLYSGRIDLVEWIYRNV